MAPVSLAHIARTDPATAGASPMASNRETNARRGICPAMKASASCDVRRSNFGYGLIGVRHPFR
jgi:hypothetical protein